MGVELGAATVITQGASLLQGHKAKKAEKKAGAIRRNLQLAEDTRKRMETLEIVRAMRAQSRNVAEQVGAEGSSAIASRTGAIASSGASALAVISEQQQGMDAITANLNKAADYQESSAVFGSAASLFAQGAVAKGFKGSVFGDFVSGLFDEEKA